MSTLSPQLDTLVEGFAKRSGVTDSQVNALREALETSQLLAQRLEKAVTDGRINQITWLPPGMNAGAAFVEADKAIALGADAFKGKTVQKQVDKLTFFLGHETEHAHLVDWKHRRTVNFRNAVDAIASSQSSVHNYTEPAERYLMASRSDETVAEIAGWNALQDRVRRTNTGKEISTAELIARADGSTACVIEGMLQPGIQLEPDGRIGGEQTNYDAIGRCHYDAQSLNTLGRLGTSDYQNYYGVFVINTIAEAERHYAPLHGKAGTEIFLDMQRLKLDEHTLEANGLELGGPGKRLRYTDISHGKAETEHFDEMRVGKPVTVTPKAEVSAAFPADHPDAALRQAIQQVLPPQTSEDRLTELTVAARTAGIRAETFKGITVHAQDDMKLILQGTTPGFTAIMDLRQPPPTQADSLQRLDGYYQDQAERQAVFQQQQERANAFERLHGPGPGGPGLELAM